MGKVPPTRRLLSNEIRKDREAARASRNASPFFGTGIHPTGNGGMESDAFDGDLDTDDAGSTGWAFNDQKVALGEVILRPGSIGNDSLTNPVVPAAVWATASAFTVSPSWSTVITRSLTVPAGFTSAIISAKGRVTAFMNQDSPANVDYLYAVLFVGGDSSDYYPVVVTDLGGSGTNHVFRDSVLTGLTPGGTVTLTLQASTDSETWTAPAYNTALMGASVQWLR